MSSTTEVLESKEDASVNFVTKGDYPGIVEARYVRRTGDYFTCYLSTQTGCEQACRFCHLTATKQTKLVDVSESIIYEQAQNVFEHYQNQLDMGIISPVTNVHFSFMARGEPLASEVFKRFASRILYTLGEHAKVWDLNSRYMVSTIMPKSLDWPSLHSIFQTVQPTIYYSIYSVDENFRNKWLPNAMPVPRALGMLKDYQDSTNKIIRLHWSFIEGENDGISDINDIVDAVKKVGLRVDVNIVRYNPFSPKLGRESHHTNMDMLVEHLRKCLPQSNIKMVSRVGFDVKASCGMFVQ